MPTSVDHSIIVRLWVDSDNRAPRARLVHLPSGAEMTAAGAPGIVEAFDRMLRELVGGSNGATPV